MTRHLYVHLPFCAQRCGYCDFVTVVGRGDQHAAYVDALLGELALESELGQQCVDVRGVLPVPPDDRDEVAVAAAMRTERQVNVEVARHFFSSFRLRTARNASCGTSTMPTCFIRFLPAFWRSSSLRFRVMSPP